MRASGAAFEAILRMNAEGKPKMILQKDGIAYRVLWPTGCSTSWVIWPDDPRTCEVFCWTVRNTQGVLTLPDNYPTPEAALRALEAKIAARTAEGTK